MPRLVGAASQQIHLQESKTAQGPHEQPGVTGSGGISSALTSQVPVIAYSQGEGSYETFPKALNYARAESASETFWHFLGASMNSIHLY